MLTVKRPLPKPKKLIFSTQTEENQLPQKDSLRQIQAIDSSISSKMPSFGRSKGNKQERGGGRLKGLLKECLSQQKQSKFLNNFNSIKSKSHIKRLIRIKSAKCLPRQKGLGGDERIKVLIQQNIFYKSVYKESLGRIQHWTKELQHQKDTVKKEHLQFQRNIWSLRHQLQTKGQEG